MFRVPKGRIRITDWFEGLPKLKTQDDLRKVQK